MSGCRVSFGQRSGQPVRLEITTGQARELLERAERDGAATIAGFYFDCLVGISGDLVLDGGERVGRLARETAAK